MLNATHLLRSHSFGRTFAFAAVVVGLLAIPASTAFAARILSSSDAALSGALLENFDSYSATEFTD